MTDTMDAPASSDPAAVHGHGDGLADGHGHGGGHPATNTGMSNEKVGMWAFLGSECLLFGGLITTYLFAEAHSKGVGPRDAFDIPFTSVSSFVLLMSSMTMVLALSAVQRGEEAKGRIWLLTTAALGASFIAGQIYEFTEFLHAKEIGYTTNLWSSAFYTLTGFHGVHVTLGIIMLLSLVGLSLRGGLGKERAETVEIVGLYWHFVDVVWILIFTVVYLVRA